jgi:O-acetyl-ADP-ribose deacetylase (regulator of RNase III)
VIFFRTGDLFSMIGEAALVNPVNCVGTAGKGLALEFKKRWPASYRAYRDRCLLGELIPGRLFVWTDASKSKEFFGKRVEIVHFPTKRHWRDKSRLEDIEVGLFELRRQLAMPCFGSVAIPALGCGDGGLDWRNVRAAMSTILLGCTQDIYIFEPERML